MSDGPVARGRQGEVWRLETVEGCWAVKVPFQESDEGRVRVSTRFQEAACAAGVPAPSVRRATDGCVYDRVGGQSVKRGSGTDSERAVLRAHAAERANAAQPDYY